MPIPLNSFPFIDLKTQGAHIRGPIECAIAKVLDHGQFILGPEVAQLEEALSQWTDGRHVVTCSDGTDALFLALRAFNVQPGDGIFVPSWTFCATAEVVVLMGAVPIFVDCDPLTHNMDPKSLDQAWQRAQTLGIHPVGVIAVDLFGQPADYNALQDRAKTYNLWVLADAAQSFGARHHQVPVGALGDIATTSFFPAKPLGCYGDGGALFTSNKETADVLRSLRMHGQGKSKYDHVRIGINGRLDTLQAAILLEKLKIFPQELKERQKIADRYTEAFAGKIQTPLLLPGMTSSWAQYTLCFSSTEKRTQVTQSLDRAHIPWVIYYQKPLHQQIAYASYPTASQEGLVVCEHLSQCVLSLPMSAYLKPEHQEAIIHAVLSAV